MKRCFSAIKKIVIGFVVNILMLLAGILTIVDATFKVISDLLESLSKLLKSFAIIASIIMLVFYIFTKDPFYDTVTRGYAIFGALVLCGGMIWISIYIVPLIMELVLMAFSVLRPQSLLNLLSLGAYALAEIYEASIEGNPDFWGLYIGCPVIFMDFCGKVLRFLVSIAAILGFTGIAGWWGYSQSFGEGLSLETFCFEWWASIAIAVLCAVYGLRMGCAVSSSLYHYGKAQEAEIE